MKKPDIPANERQRLQSLEHINILDTVNEERFDRLTRLTKQMFATKIAAISFIDTNRQWVKSAIGPLDKEIPRDITFCAHTILEHTPLVVQDTHADSRFSDNPMVNGKPGIRFYAGYPIRHRNGALIGTLSLADDEPRSFDVDEINCMKDIAALVENELVSMQSCTMQDPLTGLLNEDGFEVLSQNSLNMCERLNLPASLAFFDLSGITRINPLPKRERDNAMVFFAELLKFGFRGSDVLARLEHGKFAVLMTNTPISNTQDILNRFKKRVERDAKEKSLLYTLNYSVGVSWVEPEGEYDISHLVEIARNLARKAKV
ncbi:GAF domain-containing protein [Grimontia hollisae]|uniref:GAF domain-containing protein n=1 Tax=Grimontia hollisae TaxID=673 RepID=UPI001303101A|nr:GAF domain-containing protein [Grimontia hollisae]